MAWQSSLSVYVLASPEWTVKAVFFIVMSNDISKQSTKGKLSWVIIVLEAITAIAYLAMVFWNLGSSFVEMDFDFGEAIQELKTAVWILVISWVVIAALCFVPIFKSKFNTFIAIGNIIGVALNISFLIS